MLLAGLVSAGPTAWADGSADDFIYELQAGDNPWNITARYLPGQQYWPRLLRHNRIVDARRLPVGSQLRIPSAWLSLRAVDVRLLSVYNAVTLRQGNQDRTAVPGDQLQAGDVLTTASGASATLEIEDGSRILVRPGTSLSLVRAEGPQFGKDGRAVVLRLQLLQGAIESIVKPVRPGGRFEIETPSGVAAVRGTEYRVSATSASTTSEVVTGHVQVANSVGATVLAPVQGTKVEQGQAPQPATPLLPAPDLQGLPAKAERLPLDLPLSPLPGAVAYRTQIAADETFTQVLSDELTEAPRVRSLDVEDGMRFVRVRAVDARGLEGLATQRALEVHARPEPPLLLEPAPRASTPVPQPVLRWTRADDADRRVRVQVAPAGTSFRAPLADQTMADDGQWQIERPLVPGAYEWRVAALDPRRGQGPWGDVQAFERVLAAPGMTPPEPGAQPMTLRWKAAFGATAYRLQLARVGNADHPLSDTRVAQEQAQLAVLPPGDYTVRVQAIGSDQKASPWSAPQRFTIPEATTRWPLLLLLLPLWLI